MSSLISKILPCINTWSNTMVRKTPTVCSGTAVSQALQNVNRHTMEIYAQKKAQVKAQLGKGIPIILANQNLLSTRYRNIRRDVEYVPEQYHLLKAIAHIPIAVYTALGLKDAQELDKLRVELEGLFRPYHEYSNAA